MHLIDAEKYPCQTCNVSCCHQNCGKFVEWFNTIMDVAWDWVPVSERKPTFEELETTAEKDVCLVVVRTYNYETGEFKNVTRTAHWDGDNFVDGSTRWGSGKIEHVTHWMPYPEPPEK